MSIFDLHNRLGNNLEEKIVYEASDGECFDSLAEGLLYGLMLLIREDSVDMADAAEVLRMVVATEMQ